MGCFSSDKPKTKFELPSYLKAPSSAIASGVTSALKTKFTPYTGDRSAGLSGTQQDALAQFKDMFGGSPIRLIDDIPGSGPAAGSIKDYMDPYLASVLSPVLRQLGVAHDDRLQSLDAERHMAGAFGDTGAALADSSENQDYMRSIADATGQYSSQAFNTAMGLRSDDLNRRAQTADYLKTMFNMGGVEQAGNQKDLDAAYEEFLRKTGFTWDQLAKAASITGSIPTGTAVTTPGAPSTASQILGAAGSIGAMFI